MDRRLYCFIILSRVLIRIEQTSTIFRFFIQVLIRFFVFGLPTQLYEGLINDLMRISLSTCCICWESNFCRLFERRTFYHWDTCVQLSEACFLIVPNPIALRLLICYVIPQLRFELNILIGQMWFRNTSVVVEYLKQS